MQMFWKLMSTYHQIGIELPKSKRFLVVGLSSNLLSRFTQSITHHKHRKATCNNEFIDYQMLTLGQLEYLLLLSDESHPHDIIIDYSDESDHMWLPDLLVMRWFGDETSWKYVYNFSAVCYAYKTVHQLPMQKSELLKSYPILENVQSFTKTNHFERLCFRCENDPHINGFMHE